LLILYIYSFVTKRGSGFITLVLGVDFSG